MAEEVLSHQIHFFSSLTSRLLPCSCVPLSTHPLPLLWHSFSHTSPWGRRDKSRQVAPHLPALVPVSSKKDEDLPAIVVQIG